MKRGTAPPQDAPAGVPAARSHDLTLTVLSVLLMLVLIAGALWVLRPFLLSMIWATMIVVATWPLMLKVESAFHRRWFAVAVMSAAMVLIFVAPLLMAINAVLQNLDVITGALHKLSTASVPPPPQWVQNIPLVGTQLTAKWAALSAAGPDQLAARIGPYAANAAQWIVGAFGTGGVLLVQFLLTVIICVVMFANGEQARAGLLRFGKRLAGTQGEGAVILAGQAIRAVALGVVVTALVQTVLAGIGLAVAGVPFAGLLTGVVLLLCIAQIGPILVLAPAVAYLFWIDATTAATGLLVWTVIVGAMDNVLRPMLIKRGADLPLLLIFAGVIGGLIAFGIIGLFVGPVVLAVAYTLLQQWIAAGLRAEESAAVTRRVRAAS